MRKFLPSRVVVPLHLAFIAAYLACIQWGADSICQYLPVAFLAAGLLEVTILFPSARRGEDPADARWRVCRDVLHDPVFVIGVFGFMFIALQTLNGPRQVVFDLSRGVWSFSSARIRDFPACVDQLRSAQGLFWSLLVIPAMLAVRRGLGKRGRILLLKCLVAVMSVSAIVAIATSCFADADDAPYRFAKFQSPISAGMFFLLGFCMADGLYAIEAGAEDPRPWPRRLLVAECIACAAGVVFSLSCLSQVILGGVFVVLLVYGAIYLARRLATAEKIRMFVGGLIMLGLAAFLHFVAYPGNQINGCFTKIATPEEWMSDEEKAEREVCATVAGRMAADNRWVGVGTWGYADSDCFGKYMEDEEWDALPDAETTPQVVDNDALQFLCEYGVIGLVLLAAPFALSVLAALWRLICEFRPRRKVSDGTGTSSAGESRPFTDRVTPLALAVILAVAIPFAMSFHFSVFRDPRNLLTLAILTAVLPTLLPKPGSADR